jgi:signal transduction histidine kinase
MEFNLVSNLESCHSFIQQNQEYLRLVYYSHIPTAITALLLGLFVFLNDRKALLNRILLGIGVVFFLWSMGDLVTWISSNSTYIMFSWGLLGILDSLIFVLCLYFVYVFIDKRDLPFWGKIVLGALILPIIILTPTRINLVSFDVINCEAREGLFFTNYYYIIDLLIFLWIFILFIFRYKKADKESKKQILILFLGIESFLFLFFLTGYLSSLLESFKLLAYGLFGMTFFIGVLAYLIVKFEAFSIRLLGAQALVLSLIAIIASQFAFIKTDINKVLTGITLFIVILFGWWLVRSVKKELKQKKELEVANTELKRLDQVKNEFLSIASHQLRTPVTVIKGVISMLEDGTMDSFDEVTRNRFFDGAKIKCQKLEDIINDILNATSLINKKFSVVYREAEKIEVKEFLEKIIEGFKPETMRMKIDLTIALLDPEVPEIYGQKRYLEEAFTNLITNAVKYTPSLESNLDNQGKKNQKGTIRVSSKKSGSNIIFSIKDNGIGIPKEAIPNLFQKFSRAENAVKMYTDGTGLGLFIVKEVAEGHGGKVWVESELGKGSEFFMQLPIKPLGRVNITEYIKERADIKI